MIRWLVREARQPVRQMTPSACSESSSRSTPGLPRCRPSRKPFDGQRREVLEALVGGREQRQVVALDLAVAHRAVVDEVRLEPQQRLDAVLLGRLVELHGAVHDAVVGQPDGGLVIGRGALGQLVDVAGSVEERVLGVDVEMRDGSGCSRGGNSRWRFGPNRRVPPERAGYWPCMAIYSSLGVRRVVNACGIYTDLGGSRLAPEVWAAAARGERDLGVDGRAAGGVGSADRGAGRLPGGAGRSGRVGGDRAGRGRVRRPRGRRGDGGAAAAGVVVVLCSAGTRLHVRALRRARRRAGGVGGRRGGRVGRAAGGGAASRASGCARACRSTRWCRSRGRPACR